MSDITWPEKLASSITKTAGKSVCEEVMQGCEGLETLEDKAEWAKGAINRLDKLVLGHKTRKEIMAACSCACVSEEQIASLRAVYQKAKDIDELLEASYKNPFFVKPIRDGKTLIMTKAPFDPEKHAQAKTDEERRLYYCHCEYAKAAKGQISRTHCLCGAAWYKHIFEGILERPVQIELLKSVMQGDDVCQIAVYLT